MGYNDLSESGMDNSARVAEAKRIIRNHQTRSERYLHPAGVEFHCGDDACRLRHHKTTFLAAGLER